MKKEVLKSDSVFSKIMYYFLIFILGSFIGYIYEVIFYYLELGILNNWGILYGPWLPIYGTGAVCLSFIRKFKDKPLLLFALSIIVTGLVEYLVGYYCLNFLGLKLWDYSGLFLNIKGLVCFRSVVTFALGSLVLIYIILPIIDKYYKNNIIKYGTIIIMIMFIIDIVISNLYRVPYTF